MYVFQVEQDHSFPGRSEWERVKDGKTTRVSVYP